jgi:drug/metabolite transporter (DMT)-like permease
METKKKSIFQRPLWVVIFALTAAIAWGWAYPLIKLGFEEFGITPQMTGSKMLFAGIRFMISGLIILAIAWNTKKNFQVKRSFDWWYILLFALLNTTIHYACFYIGLSHSDGARAAILNSLGVFMLVLLACLFFKTDKLNFRKIMGCIMGFSGILILNI